jgi:hypothetical protein
MVTLAVAGPSKLVCILARFNSSPTKARRDDTQHNDTQHNDTQHNDTQHYQ